MQVTQVIIQVSSSQSEELNPNGNNTTAAAGWTL